MGLVSAKRNAGKASSGVPLVVDLDGTLIATDVFFEAILRFIVTCPSRALRLLPIWWLQGLPSLKARVAACTAIEVEILQYNQSVLAFVRREKAKGRQIYIASASDIRHVRMIADHLGFFSGVFSSNGVENLKGTSKRDMLCEVFGVAGFDYIGDSKSDLPVWDQAHTAIAVARSGSVVKALSARRPEFHSLASGGRALSYYLKLGRRLRTRGTC